MDWLLFWTILVQIVLASLVLRALWATWDTVVFRKSYIKAASSTKRVL